MADQFLHCDSVPTSQPDKLRIIQYDLIQLILG